MRFRGGCCGGHRLSGCLQQELHPVASGVEEFAIVAQRAEGGHDARKNGIDLVRRRHAAAGVRADQQRVAPGGPGDGNVAKSVLAIVAGLVAGPPGFGQAGAQPLVTGLAIQHPTCQALAGVRRQRPPKYQALQVARHGGGRGGVVGIAERPVIQLRFVVIQAAYRIADGSPICGERRRTADARQQSIGTSIVAELDGCLAHVGYGHGTLLQVLPGNGRVLHQITGTIGDQLVQMRLTALDIGQNAGGER